VLRVLEAGGETFDTATLALHAGASLDSTRRALRKLRRAGRVAGLGYGPRGKVWGLPGAVTWRREVWPADREAHLSSVMGPRFARAFRRAVLGAL